MNEFEIKETECGDTLSAEAMNHYIFIDINSGSFFNKCRLPLNKEEALKLAHFILENVK